MTTTNSDPFAKFKAAQREAWAAFGPVEISTTIPAAKLVKFAQVKPGQKVLDVACGAGVVAVNSRQFVSSRKCSIVAPRSSMTSPLRRQFVTCTSAASRFSSPACRSGAHCAGCTGPSTMLIVSSLTFA